ncbi:hypothetical protein Tco_1254561 [Tanacetum coccineum]
MEKMEMHRDGPLSIGNAKRKMHQETLMQTSSRDLKPVELGRFFDVITVWTWLTKISRCDHSDEKLVQVPYGNETLTFCGNESTTRERIPVDSYLMFKAQEYMAKGCQVRFSTNPQRRRRKKTGKETKEDVTNRPRFSVVFREVTCPVFSSRPVEFKRLSSRSCPRTRAPYRLAAPSAMKELSEQLQSFPTKDS